MPTPEFFSLITAAGLAELAAAVSGNYSINFTQIVVGDGNGSYHQPGGNITHFATNGSGGTRVTAPDHDLVNGEVIDISGTANYDSFPSHYTVFNCNIGAGTFDISLAFTVDDAVGQWNRIALVNQVWPITGPGGPINAVYVHPDHANWVVIEGYVPAAEGGFTVREVGIISPGIGGNVLFAVGKVPESEKPVISSGSVKDLYFRIILVTSNVANITLVVDPNVILATQTYVQLFAKWATETERLIAGVVFEPDVVQGDAVYYNPSTSQFGRAIANGTVKQNSVGFADVNHCCVIRGGYFPWPNSTLTPGIVYYLSTTTLGGIQTTPPTRYTVEMGIALAINIMDVMVDDILSAYEDRAMTFNNLGDVGFLRSITVALDILAGNNITAGALVQAPNGNFLSQLGVGSEGGFPAFLVNNFGDILITGGSDSLWAMYHNGIAVLGVDAAHEVYIYMGGALRSGSVLSSPNKIPIGNASGKIDTSWLTGGGILPSMLPTALPGPLIIGFNAGLSPGTYPSYTTMAETRVDRPGTITASFGLVFDNIDPGIQYIEGSMRVYKNGVYLATYSFDNSVSTQPAPIFRNITVAAGDLIGIDGWSTIPDLLFTQSRGLTIALAYWECTNTFP